MTGSESMDSSSDHATSTNMTLLITSSSTESDIYMVTALRKKSFNIFLISISTLCATVCLLVLFMGCSIGLLMLKRHMQKKRKALASSQHIYAELEPGPAYEVVGEDCITNQSESKSGQGILKIASTYERISLSDGSNVAPPVYVNTTV